MRANAPEFDQFNQSPTKDLRLVVKFGFSTPLYVSSHSGIPNVPAGTFEGLLQKVSSSSQQLNPDEGRSTIGALSFHLVDQDGAITGELNQRYLAAEGMTGVTVELYRGAAGMDWSNFRLEQTQEIARSIEYRNGGYSIQCSDIQRALRNDIFDLAKTRLAAELAAGATTVEVFDTSDFEACAHTASFGDQTSGAWYYFKIKYSNGFEIVRASGKTATSFTGLTRGMFGTDDVAHALPTGSESDRGVEIEEYVYLELPAPAAAYALLTGSIPNGGGTIPARWNLGISSNSVDFDSFVDIGEDWFDSSDFSKGLILRLQGLEKEDGKRFIEREVCLLAGGFLRVGSNGKLYMRRMTGVISTSDYVAELDESNIVSHSAVRFDLSKIHNVFDIAWSWVQLPSESRARFFRRDILADANSININGQQKPLKLSFKGLHNERHTYTTIANRFNALRDRYTGPPIRFSATLLPSMNDLEVGDIVRVRLSDVRDFTGSGGEVIGSVSGSTLFAPAFWAANFWAAGFFVGDESQIDVTVPSLDRAFEIQHISIDQDTGRVNVELFGSTLEATAIPDDGAGANAELPDGWYSSEGTELSTELSIDGSGILQASDTLVGGTTTRTIFYYLGDFTIASGLTLTITGNVELRIRGQLQINGTVRVSGGQASNTAGFIGTTYGGRSLLIGNGLDQIRPAPRILGQHSAMPVLEIENNAGVLVGIPADMRGSGGGKGGGVYQWEFTQYLLEQGGAAGGAGGGSLVTVSRGAGYGVAGETDLSGADGSQSGIFAGHSAGSGGGGAPGCLVHLLDGSQVTFPILSGNVIAEYGTSPISNSDATTPGKASAADPVDLATANARVSYVPKSRDPYPDYGNTEVETGTDGLSIYTASIYQRSLTAPSTPTGGSYNFTTKSLTPPAGWFTTPPAANGTALWISQATFSIQGGTGVASSPTWSAPAVFVSDAPYIDIKFRRSNTIPATPTGDNPAGWYDEVPSGTAPLWQIAAAKNSAGVLLTAWPPPERVEGMTYRGPWSSVTAYLLHDIVIYAERSYICVQANTNNAPTGSNAGNAYWDLFAGKGDTGATPSSYSSTLAITGTEAVNLRALADADGYNGVDDATVTFNLASGITITGNEGVSNSGVGGHGIDTGVWPSSATIDLTLNITGTVRGGGGGGGRGGHGNNGNGQPGGDGGDAIWCQESIDITVNSGGVVEASGGGGEGGGGLADPPSEPLLYGGGGGGGGFPNGGGGVAGFGDLGTPTAGATGTTSGGGAGGLGAGNAGDGGDGGDVNDNGSGGELGGGGVGDKGYAIRKNGYTVNVTNNGTITGTQA